MKIKLYKYGDGNIIRFKYKFEKHYRKERNMIKISIIVPIYNVEKYLEKCIKSILNQSFKEFELILVDDGSPDNCGDICDKYLNLDNRVRVIHKKNGGLSSARNAGLKIANGEYVAFVDSDDWVRDIMYEKLYSIAQKGNADIVQCKYINAFDENIRPNIENDTNMEIIGNYDALNNLYNGRYEETVVTWNKLYKRELFNRIEFPEGRIHEDEFTTHKLLYKAKKIILYDKEMYYYRQTPNSIMNSKFNLKRFDLLEALKERSDFFNSINNKVLYRKTIQKYIYVLISYYYRAEEGFNDKKMLKKLRNDYNSKFYEYLRNDEVKFKEKVMGSIFFISPFLYKKIQIKRGKVLY